MRLINYDQLTPELAREGCFVLNMPEYDYHNYSAAVSKSELDLLDRSPAHLVYAQEREATRNMAIGSAIHCAILEPERFERDYVVLNGINDRRKSEYKQAVKHHHKDLVLTGSEGDKVKGMQSAIQANPEAQAILSGDGHAEVSAFVECPKTGLLLRCRYDWLDELGSLDLKKTQDIRYEKFQKSVANYRYHVQDAYYSYIFELITGNKGRFLFLTVEEDQPHANKIYELDTEAKIIGKRDVMANLKQYKQCKQDDYWPGIAHESELLSLPSWAIDEEDFEL